MPAVLLVPNVTLSPWQMVASLPAMAVGPGVMVTSTLFDLEQPVAVIVCVRVYVVVVDPLTTGFEMVAELKIGRAHV